MKLISARSVAAALAVAVTGLILQAIATLAHVDAQPLPVVTMPTVEVVAKRPAAEQAVEVSATGFGAM